MLLRDHLSRLLVSVPLSPCVSLLVCPLPWYFSELCLDCGHVLSLPCPCMPPCRRPRVLYPPPAGCKPGPGTCRKQGQERVWLLSLSSRAANLAALPVRRLGLPRARLGTWTARRPTNGTKLQKQVRVKSKVRPGNGEQWAWCAPGGKGTAVPVDGAGNGARARLLRGCGHLCHSAGSPEEGRAGWSTECTGKAALSCPQAHPGLDHRLEGPELGIRCPEVCGHKLLCCMSQAKAGDAGGLRTEIHRGRLACRGLLSISRGSVVSWACGWLGESLPLCLRGS